VPRVAELAGGVGGAKLADGLQAVVGRDLTVVVNTGDDLERHGLAVWPDHDTVAYTLAGLDDQERGWGLANETWTVIDILAARGEDAWFRLGDRDIATHLVRTERLRRGERPTDIARALGVSLGVAATILPMTDDAVRTEVRTPDGWLEFQEYFVHRGQRPEVLEVRFRGIDAACITPEATAAIEAAEVIVIAPSNPIVSTGPILALPGVREALAAAATNATPIVAESGIVGGRALRGPADRMLATLGHEPTALGVARIYRGVAGRFVLDEVDAELERDIQALGMRTLVTDTIMTDDAARARLAADVLGFAVAP
jgi:LPPG:FO 2-phospho-L-lactate transferase